MLNITTRLIPLLKIDAFHLFFTLSFIGLGLCTQVSAEVSTDKLPVLTGTEIVTLDSESVGDQFVLYVRVPPEASSDKNRRFPVIYTLDGDHTFPMMASAVTQLGWSGSVPPVIVVGIGYGTLDLSNGNHRSRDLSPQLYGDDSQTGGAPEFHNFLNKEAMPYIEKNYPADSTRRYLFGHSLGGLFSLYTYVKDPDAFTGIIAGSPFLAGQLDLLSSIADGSPKRSTRLYISTGDEEEASLFIDDLNPLLNFLETSWAEPTSFEMNLLPGFDHFTSLAPSITKGLKSVFNRELDSE
ncbi:alpha/beta hydrolase-fold protein [Puniceicoccaceae bacterium K14]|nr:alpha/beta hydrolase-fold protein [Puniceicoccaceae bacterium K14]